MISNGTGRDGTGRDGTGPVSAVDIIYSNGAGTGSM